jgi:8-oxo-dGTP pyrophosphatase MutT (NUDIX family)
MHRMAWPDPDGPVDLTVPPLSVDEGPRPGRFTLMAPGWRPPARRVTQALGLCFTAAGMLVMVRTDGLGWSLPGGTIEPGETVEQALIRELAEEACARVVRHRFLACQHVADPYNPDGPASYYQSRWWARVELDPWQPRYETLARRLVRPDQFLEVLCWSRKEYAARLLGLALAADCADRRLDRGATIRSAASAGREARPD